jgi:NitT/TauT family transport system permease protein
MQPLFLRKIWGEASGAPDRPRKSGWVDIIVVLGLVGLFFGALSLFRQAAGTTREHVAIDLSPWALPQYTLFSLLRGLAAYALSLVFTLAYGYWAAKDQVAEKGLIPLLDILQSLPVLAFMPGLAAVLGDAFGPNNIGLEVVAILTIFTGQAWNMTFSFYHSLRSIPEDQREAATVYRFNWWQRFKWVELPFSTMGLVWNSMMSMAGGWFFLITSEAFIKVGDQDFRLPGIGSYMREAIEGSRIDCICYAILAMVLMIVLLDQLLWRPVVAWAQKFRVEEGGAQEEAHSWFLDWLRRSRAFEVIRRLGALRARRRPVLLPREVKLHDPTRTSSWPARLSLLFFALLSLTLIYGAWKLSEMLLTISRPEWGRLLLAAGLTFGRVMAATFLGTLWALPAGLAIGLSPRLSRILQPVVQVMASFPAPMLFPLVVIALVSLNVTLDWGSILLILLGTQWYILFNVIAGAMAIPADLKEAARSYRLNLWQRFRALYLPAIFPYLVTGWVTATGGAWNASIVAEFNSFNTEDTKGLLAVDIAPANGLGAVISNAFKEMDKDHHQLAILAASSVLMSLVVVLFNRLVWRRLYNLAEERYSLSK